MKADLKLELTREPNHGFSIYIKKLKVGKVYFYWASHSFLI